MDRLIIDVPITFEATFIRPKKRNEEDGRFLTYQPMEIPSYQSDEVEVAGKAVYQRQPNHDTKLWSEMVYYKVGDKLVCPVSLTRDGFLRLNEPDPKDVVSPEELPVLLNEALKKEHHVYGLDITYLFGAVPEGEVPVRTWVEDNREEVIAQVQQSLDKLCFVDGVLCCETVGPVFKVCSGSTYNQQGDRLALIGEVHVIPDASLIKDEWGDWSYMSPLNLDGARAQAEFWANRAQGNFLEKRGENYPVGGVLEIGRVEVYRPEMFPSAENDLLKVAAWTLHGLFKEMKYRYDEMTGDQFRALSVLRDAYPPGMEPERYKSLRLGPALEAIETVRAAWNNGNENYSMQSDFRKFDEARQWINGQTPELENTEDHRNRPRGR
jgi:hypothetical protein